MLEGHEISIVPKSKLDRIQDRLDSEFYQKKYIEYGYILKKQGFKTLEDWGAQLDCSAFYPAITDYYNFEGRGIPFIRVNEIQDGMVEITKATAFLPPFVLDMNSKTIAKTYPNDIIIAKGGNTLAKVGIVTDEYPEYAVCRDVIVLRTHNIPENVRYYIWGFMHSNYGYEAMIRTASQTGQPHLTLPFVLNLKVPYMSQSFYSMTKELYDRAKYLRDNANRLYEETDRLLGQTLNVDFSMLDNQSSSHRVQTFRNSFLSSGRLDAEYYQHKYDWLFSFLRSAVTKRLGDITNIQKSIEPGSDLYETGGIPFVRVADITKFGITEPSVYLNPELFRDVIRPKKDAILLTKDGSVGIAYKVEKDENFVTSGAILHLYVNNDCILPDYLALIINSKIVQMQAERDAGGSIIQHWKPSEISDVIIPVIPMEDQIWISSKVQESFRLRHESNRLLDVAKQAVEIAISKNEETALKFLKDNG